MITAARGRLVRLVVLTEGPDEVIRPIPAENDPEGSRDRLWMQALGLESPAVQAAAPRRPSKHGPYTKRAFRGHRAKVRQKASRPRHRHS